MNPIGTEDDVKQAMFFLTCVFTHAQLSKGASPMNETETKPQANARASL